MDKIINTSTNPEVMSVLNKIHEIGETSEQGYSTKIVEVVNKIVYQSKNKKTERILIPIDKTENISITKGMGTAYGTNGTSMFSDIKNIKNKIFSTNAFDEILTYMTPEGAENLKEIKKILDKYDFPDIRSGYGDDTGGIHLKKKIAINVDEKAFVLKKINADKIVMEITPGWGGNVNIKFTDECYTDFDFEYRNKTENNYIISLAIAEKYPTEILSVLNEYLDKFRKKYTTWYDCYNDLKTAFAKYLILDMMVKD